MDGEGSERRADTEALAFRPQVPDLGGDLEQFLINVSFLAWDHGCAPTLQDPECMR